MTPEEQEHRRAQWTPEKRALAAEKARHAWRAAHPDKAALRDEIMAGRASEPCGQCGSTPANSFVDYQKRSVKWRCRACADTEKREYTAARVQDPIAA